MSQLESFRVPLVDDDARRLESMEAVLADRFAVRCCTSAYEALPVVDMEPFHVARSDCRTPAMDGVAFFQAVARRERANHIASVAHLKRHDTAHTAAVLGDPQ